MSDTITVQSHFGDKEVTKEDFVNQWVSHANQLYSLAEESADFTMVISIKAKVSALAKKTFDSTFKLQQKQVA